MSVRTAQGWYNRDQEDPQDVIKRKQAKGPVGRPAKLHEKHGEFLVELLTRSRD
jgi:transposase